MQAVIMAAGLGTRLRPHTDRTPKPMLRVAGRPILEWSIERLPASVDEVIIVVGYRKEQIIGHFGAAWRGRRIRYVEQPELKGTGDAVHRCRSLLDGRFLALNGDDLYGPDDLERLLEHDLAILAEATDVPGRFGAFRTDERGHLIDIIEGADIPAGGLVNAGAYALDGRFFDQPLVPIKNGTEFGLPQTLVLLAKEHAVRILAADFWLPIGYPEDLEKASAVLSGQRTAGSLRV
jgi:bifunctional UDP-N-acetylglucosamine pyrophosphorylase/glucosamine-1-phosphate N-acetyltransferase